MWNFSSASWKFSPADNGNLPVLPEVEGKRCVNEDNTPWRRCRHLCRAGRNRGHRHCRKLAAYDPSNDGQDLLLFRLARRMRFHRNVHDGLESGGNAQSPAVDRRHDDWMLRHWILPHAQRSGRIQVRHPIRRSRASVFRLPWDGPSWARASRSRPCMVRIPELDRSRGALKVLGDHLRLRERLVLFHSPPGASNAAVHLRLRGDQMAGERRSGFHHPLADLHVRLHRCEVRRPDFGVARGGERRHMGPEVLERDDAVLGHLRHDDPQCLGLFARALEGDGPQPADYDLRLLDPSRHGVHGAHRAYRLAGHRNQRPHRRLLGSGRQQTPSHRHASVHRFRPSDDERPQQRRAPGLRAARHFQDPVQTGRCPRGPALDRHLPMEAGLQGVGRRAADLRPDLLGLPRARLRDHGGRLLSDSPPAARRRRTVQEGRQIQGRQLGRLRRHPGRRRRGLRL